LHPFLHVRVQKVVAVMNRVVAEQLVVVGAATSMQMNGIRQMVAHV